MLTGSVIASAFAPNIEVFIVLRVFNGLAAGMLPPTSVGVLSDVISPERRAQAVSSFLAIGILTSALSVPVALGLADLGGWRFAFIVAGTLLATGLLASWLWFPKDRRDKARNLVFFSATGPCQLPYFQTAVTVGLSQRIAFWTMVSYFAVYLRDTFELSAGFAALPWDSGIGTGGRQFLRRGRRHVPLQGSGIGATSVAGGCAPYCALPWTSRCGWRSRLQRLAEACWA